MHSFTPKQVANLQRGVRAALGFGIATSITANVIHSLTRPDLSHLATWQVWAGAGLAALAPLVLFISTEMVTRIPVHSKVLGWTRLIITFILGGFSAWVSYWHMVGVCELLGESGGAQYIYPLIIDGMMIVATISLIELGRIATTVEAAVAAQVEPKAPALRVTEAEKQARKRSGYSAMSTAEKAAWTKNYRERTARRTQSVAPTSPGRVPVDAPSVEEVEQIAA